MKRLSIVLGLLMLIIGGIAIFANLKKIWLIMFVVELINVALFLVRPTSPQPPRCSVRGVGAAADWRRAA